MFTKTVIAEDSTRAMDEVVKQLGPEAIVLSNKRVPNGIEIVAGLPEKHDEGLDLETYLNGDRDGQPSPSREKFKDLLRQAKTGGYNDLDFPDEEQAKPTGKKANMTTADFLTKRDEDDDTGVAVAPSPAQTSPRASAKKPLDITSDMPDLHVDDETVSSNGDMRLGAIYESLREIKEFMRSEMVSCDMAMDKATRNLILQFRMKGFASPVLNAFTENNADAGNAVDAEVLFSAFLADKLASHDDVLQQDHLSVALVGGSGVGKTTMLVKMAARKKLLDPKAKIAFVSTDTSRLGATEQLRVCGKILNIPVLEGGNAEQLVEILENVDPSVNLFFDMPSRVDACLDCLDLLDAVGERLNLQKLVAVSPTMSGAAIDRILTTFKPHTSRVVLTKLDECDTIGEVASALVMNNMTIEYMSNGCDIVNGLHLADTGSVKGQLYHYLREETPA